MNMLSDSQATHKAQRHKGIFSKDANEQTLNSKCAYKALPRLDVNDDDDSDFRLEDLLHSGMNSNEIEEASKVLSLRQP